MGLRACLRCSCGRCLLETFWVIFVVWQAAFFSPCSAYNKTLIYYTSEIKRNWFIEGHNHTILPGRVRCQRVYTRNNWKTTVTWGAACYGQRKTDMFSHTAYHFSRLLTLFARIFSHQLVKWRRTSVGRTQPWQHRLVGTQSWPYSLGLWECKGTGESTNKKNKKTKIKGTVYFDFVWNETQPLSWIRIKLMSSVLVSNVKLTFCRSCSSSLSCSFWIARLCSFWRLCSSSS